MPKSKRDRKVALTRVQKKTRERKEALVANIQKCAEEFPHVFVVSFHNMRTRALKDLRIEWRDDCRFFLGKNKVMQLALGHTPEEAIRPGYEKISEYLVGQVGLLFSKVPRKNIEKNVGAFSELEFAKSGHVAEKNVELAAGELTQFQFTMEPVLRKLGLPVKLKEGVVLLERDFVVCKAGDTLTPDQARILKHFDVKMADFKIELNCHLNEGKFHAYTEAPVAKGAGGAMDEDSD